MVVIANSSLTAPPAPGARLPDGQPLPAARRAAVSSRSLRAGVQGHTVAAAAGEHAQTHTFLFADLCGYTEYTCRHGDWPAAELAVAFHRRIAELARDERCHFIKSIGDAVMVRADDTRRALTLAGRVIALNGSEGYPPVRVGIDVGPAVELAGDWFGSTVNTAARVADAAAPGEVVLTERACAMLHEAPGIRLVARGVWSLKGLPEIRVHTALA
jgi:adenylate cyclase